MTLYGGIEAGGTKFICAVGTGPNDLRAETRFATTTPEETIPRAIAFFQPYATQLAAIGIGSFGPIDPRPASPAFGYITTTPKPGWAHTDFVGPLQKIYNLPIGFDTDVNAAALGEQNWGAAQGLDTFIYLTIGTGIGGGVMVEGNLLHGVMHPEMGHIFVPHNREQDSFEGSCPYHGDCLEGLASGPALESRWGVRAESLPNPHPAWELESSYLADAIVNYTLPLAPQRVILGGGVMQQAHLFPLIREKVQKRLNGYLAATEIIEQMEGFIVPPALGQRAGILGALALAQQAFHG